MGFFDPPHKKMIAMGPPAFRETAPLWGVFLEAAIKLGGVPPFHETAFRAFVVGHLAQIVAREDPAAWQPHDLQYVIGTTKHAERSLPAQYHGLAVDTVESLARGAAD